MKKNLSSLAFAALTVLGTLCTAGLAAAQVAGGSTTVGVSIVESTQLDAFVAAADKDIAKGKAAVASLEKKAGAAAADAKTKIEADITTLQSDVKSAEAKLVEMKQVTAARWKEFEADVSAATARLRKSTEKATG